MSSSYHIEWKTFIEASDIYKIHTGEKIFVAATFEGLWESFQFRQSKKTWSIIWSAWVFFAS